MLQRIQTLFLALAAVGNLLTFVLPMWQFAEGDNLETLNGLQITAEVAGSEGLSAQSFTANPFHIAFFALTILVSLIILITIFQFKDRKRQIRLVTTATILTLVEIVAFVLLSQRGPFLIGDFGGEGVVQIGFALPVVTVLLLWIARRRIQADEDLVRSIDRIR
jgi:hypothetical protein